jgi:uncharacterized protein (TIGR03435 family)
MARMDCSICLLAVFPVLAFAQEFEVASVKVAPPRGSPGAYNGMGTMGGPGTSDPTRIRYRNFTLKALVGMAYDVPYFQISGPGWVEDEHYEIIATLPKDTTKEQAHVMLRNLVAERFQLKIHHETKEVSMYSLLVAKNGPKLVVSKPVVADGDAGAVEAGPLKKDKDGFPVLRKGMRMAMMSDNGHPVARAQGVAENLDYLTSMLSVQLAAPVVNSTGLTEKYDFTISWVPQPPGGAPPDKEEFGPDLFSALQDQLGLKLVAKKGPVEMLVIDHAEKVPLEN